MDTSSTPTSDSPSLSTSEAGAAFSAMLDPIEREKEQDVPTQSEAESAANAQDEGAEAEPTPDASDTITVLIDGKEVALTKAQVAEAYKDGLRQADYTRKTQEVSEQRKTAEAETAQARQERNQFAQELQRHQAQLEGALQEQQSIDWQALLNADPVEYLKQQHLAQSRQAALQQNVQQQQNLATQANAERKAGHDLYLTDQRAQLLAKIPEWKDAAKQKAGAAELRAYLLDAGYSEADVANVDDHRAVVSVRKAMLYDQMMAKASVAAKKVANLPQRMERPAGNDSQGMDRRATAYQRLSKSGSVNDAAAVFSSLLS